MPLDSLPLAKRAESPDKPSLPPRPMGPDIESKTTTTESVSIQQTRASSRPPSRTAAVQPTKNSTQIQQSSYKAASQPQRGCPQKTIGAPTSRDQTDEPQTKDSFKAEMPSTTADENQRLHNDNAASLGRIRELENLLGKQRTLNEELVKQREKVAAQAEENWRLWKSTARELRKIKQTPTHHQVTDSQLTGLIQQLRYAIRDFSVQYFRGIPRSSVSEEALEIWNSYMVPTTPGSEAYQEYIKSPSRCASVIQAMLWRLLNDRVFGKFAWAGKAGDSLCDLRYYMKHAFRHQGIPDPELERKFQVWSAEATALVLQMCDFSEGSQEYKRVQITRKEIREDFFLLANQYLATTENAPGQDFRRILDHAMALDREIYRQAARINWEFLRPDAHVGFEPKLMEVEKGQQRPKPDQPVILVVAPGVTKRGRSDGQLEGFQAEEQLLMPMEVSCQLPSDIPATSTAASKSSWFRF